MKTYLSENVGGGLAHARLGVKAREVDASLLCGLQIARLTALLQ